jgi:hypothetical protein
MGKSAQLNFAPKIFGRNFAELGEFPPNQQIFGWKLDVIRPNRKNRPQILGRNLTARIHPFSGEQKLLCRNANKEQFCIILFVKSGPRGAWQALFELRIVRTWGTRRYNVNY